MEPGALVLGRYHLHEQVGAGGSGVVWRATDQVLHQLVALKRVSFAGLDEEQAQRTRDRVLREARLAAQLNAHPRVITVYDVRVDEGDIWLVMEYLPSRSLGELLRTQGRLDPTAAARIGAQIADALDAAHARAIEHRDVKPGNVLIGVDGTVKLADFGISHLTGDPHLTHTGITGTPAYLAPEVVGRGESSPASDIFSLGSTLYTAVEGQPPFGLDDNTFRLLNVIRNGIIRPPVHAGPLEPVLLRLLQVDPNVRPDAVTTRDILSRLTTRVTDTPEHLRPRARPPAQPKTRWWLPSRHTALAAGALIAVAATTGTIGLIAVSGNPGQGETLPTEIPPPAPTATAAPPIPTAPTIQALRDANPCPLIDLAALKRFGTPKQVPGPYLNTCQVDIDINSGDVQLRVYFDEPTAVSDLDVTPERIGDVTIARLGLNTSGVCQNQLVLTENLPSIFIEAHTYDDYPGDLCRIADVGTTAAVKALERDNGITYTENRTAEYSHAGADACTVLDGTTLSRVPGLDLNDPRPGYANWSCRWKEKPEGNSVELQLRVEDSGTIGFYEDNQKITPGMNAFIEDNEPQTCGVVLVHRTTYTNVEKFEIIEVEVKGPLLPEEQRCALAAELVAAAEEKIPD